MARISLRAYQREIEDLIETHQFDQAIAHCRHILKFYPKDINTYRLLGKGYLESQRYGDASDIFLRVLSSVPDDFVSNVGMSIIREDEGNLDEAIWHMERAFESQPANNAIQAELRRLHGRREGVEPPKIRLTRGALARMYIKGELYQQAITELRAGLNEHPHRRDLQVVLAQAYYKSGQRIDAAEVCSSVLKSLPYCLEANRILAEILRQNDRAEEAQVYSKHVNSLDPYSAHTTPAALTSETVADNAVLLEKLEWRPGMPITNAPAQPEWASSLGVDLGTSASGKDSLPDWLYTPAESPAVLPESASPPFVEEVSSIPALDTQSSGEAIPDWMKEAGWGPATEPADLVSPSSVEEMTGTVDDLQPAEIPDWLKHMAPITSAAVNDQQEPNDEIISAAEEVQAIGHPWLEETPPQPTDSIVTWLGSQPIDTTEQEPLEIELQDEVEVPDWLSDLSQATSEEQGFDIDDAIVEESEKSPSTDQQIPAWSIAVTTQLSPSTLFSEDVSPDNQEQDILSELVQEAPAASEKTADISEWLESLEPVDQFQADTQMSTAIESLESIGEKSLESDELPDWLASFDQATQETPIQQTVEGFSSESTEILEPIEEPIIEPETSETEEIPAWLVGLEAAAVTQEILPEPEAPLHADVEAIGAATEMTSAGGDGESPTDMHDVEQLSTLPDIMEQAENSLSTPEYEEESPVTEAMESGVSSESIPLDDEEAFAWLENLAARQGAEDALLLSPDERRETPPGWVQTDGEEYEVAPTKTNDLVSSVLEEEQAETVSEVDQPDWVLEDTQSPDTSPDIVEVSELAEEDLVERGIPVDLIVETPLESISLDEEPPSTEDTKPTILASMKAELPSATLATTPAYADQIQPSQEQPLTEGSPEDTEAFAWLDGLAAKQGADEAMLLESDQRMNTPPGWVIQSLQTEVTDSSEPDTTPVPDWLKHKDPDDEFQELVVASNFPDWLKPTTPVDEVRREQSIESNVPELPKWLSGADAKEEFGDIWGTSEKTLDIAREPRTTGTVDTNKPSDVSEISSKKVDLNEAGLSDLEHLPGIGFSKAQAILEYRSIHGPFKSVDELANVAGISERMLDEFRDQVTAGSDEYTEAVEQPVNEHQVLLLQARNALVLGDIQAALRHYQALIKQRAVIPEVISDLNEALYRFPVDVYIWETLGDAHARSGNLQEALNAYTKAEEYIR